MPRPAVLLALAVVLAATPAFADDARLLIRQADELGPSYRLEAVTYSVGRQVVGNRTGFETRPALRKVPTDGPRATVPSGPRELTVEAVIRGVGVGQFAYLNRYRIAVTGVCELSMLSEITTTVDVVITRRAGLLAEFEEGLDIECRNVGIEQAR